MPPMKLPTLNPDDLLWAAVALGVAVAEGDGTVLAVVFVTCVCGVGFAVVAFAVLLAVAAVWVLLVELATVGTGLEDVALWGATVVLLIALEGLVVVEFDG